MYVASIRNDLAYACRLKDTSASSIATDDISSLRSGLRLPLPSLGAEPGWTCLIDKTLNPAVRNKATFLSSQTLRSPVRPNGRFGVDQFFFGPPLPGGPNPNPKGFGSKPLTVPANWAVTDSVRFSMNFRGGID